MIVEELEIAVKNMSVYLEECHDEDDAITLTAKVLKSIKENYEELIKLKGKDCEKCIHFGKHATQYPCSHCRNCYTDKFQPNDTRTPQNDEVRE